MEVDSFSQYKFTIPEGDGLYFFAEVRHGGIHIVLPIEEGEPRKIKPAFRAVGGLLQVESIDVNGNQEGVGHEGSEARHK